MKPHYSPFQIWCSHYIFVNNFFQFYSRNKYTAIFGFCKGWAVEKCTEAVLKMFWKLRNEQNKSRYFFFKRPVAIRDITVITTIMAIIIQKSNKTMTYNAAIYLDIRVLHQFIAISKSLQSFF